MGYAWMVLGSGGMLGSALQSVLAEGGERVVAWARADLDIADPEACGHALAEFAGALDGDEVGVVVNAAAYTDVERAEEEVEVAFAVNAYAPTRLAGQAKAAGLRFAHVSTDFVFDGQKAGPYREDDETDPLSVYGASKLAGERGVAEAFPESLLVRTAWVFGPGGANFPGKVIALARERGELSVVTDEIGSPTYTIDLATGILALAREGAHGLYHLAGSGSCSRFELAEVTLQLAGVQARLRPVGSASFPTKAARPSNSVLDCSKAEALGVRMPSWQDALGRYIVDCGDRESRSDS